MLKQLVTTLLLTAGLLLLAGLSLRPVRAAPPAPGYGNVRAEASGQSSDVGPANGTLIVNSTGDGADAAPGDDVCQTASAGECTLRAAIMESNANTGLTQTIAFSLAGGGPHVIAPASALPQITRPVTIDGLTQPGASCDSWPPTLLIELDGTNVPASGLTPPIGLNLSANNSTVRGLVINNFQDSVNIIIDIITMGTAIAVNRSANHTIECNFIGLEPDGDTAAPNEFGIALGNATNNTIRQNLISGNGDDGIIMGVDPLEGGESDGNRILDNYIGVDRTGLLARGNVGDGVLLVNARNTVISGNLISGNGDDGIDVTDNVDAGAVPPIHACTTPPCATGNQIQHNKIGLDLNGNATLGNDDNGVQIEDAERNTIQYNIIAGNGVEADNGAHGVQIDDLGGGACTKGELPCAISNTIRANSIYSNTSLGIDLTGGAETGRVTANDGDDSDTGSNGLQNYPVLGGALHNGTEVTITGTLQSKANTTYTLEFFANAACDPTGFGEGETFLISDTVTTDGSGSAAFQVTIPSPAGPYVTAVAADPDGNTSEFSACVPIVGTEVADNPLYLPLVMKPAQS